MKNIFTLIALFVGISPAAMAGDLELANESDTGGPGRTQGIAVGKDPRTTRVAIAIEKNGKSLPQSYCIRVRNDGGRRIITVSGADAVGAMYGGLDRR